MGSYSTLRQSADSPETPTGVGWLVCAAIIAAGGLLGPTLSPTRARAANPDQKIESLIDEATDAYDNLKIEAARKKLKKAIRIGKNQDASDEVFARAYVTVGIVEYGVTREKERALKAFKAALKQDPDAAVTEAYKTPKLKKIMDEARDSVDLEAAREDDESDDTGGSQPEVDSFTHEPISTTQAGEPLEIEARAPTDMAIDTVEFVYKRYQEDWQRIQLEAENATTFVKKIPGFKIRTSQISYYIEATNPSGKVIASSGSKNSPHLMTVLGSSSYTEEKWKEDKKEWEQNQEGDSGGGEETDQDGDDGSGETDGGGDGGDDSVEPSEGGPSGFVDLSVGTGVGFIFKGGYSPTANPDRAIGTAGFVTAIMHAQLSGGYIFPGGSQLGVYFRYQFLPVQNFDEIRDARGNQALYRDFQTAPCFGTGIPGDCMFGLKYRYFFESDGPVQFFSSVGAGLGKARHWLRLRERAYPDDDSRSGFCEGRNKDLYVDDQGRDYCHRFDTVRPGWIHFGVGGGLVYEVSTNFALMAEAYLEILLPDNTAPNLDINIGPQFRF